MTKQTQIEFIKEACVKANESIKDLVMGCKIKHEPSNYMGIDYQGNYIHEARGKDMHLIYFPGSEEGSQRAYSTTISINDFKILGRDIQLADVLLAIEKVTSDYSVSNLGYFEKWTKFEDRNNVFVLESNPKNRWNLLLPLHLQEDATIEFLYKLLSNKE